MDDAPSLAGRSAVGRVVDLVRVQFDSSTIPSAQPGLRCSRSVCWRIGETASITRLRHWLLWTFTGLRSVSASGMPLTSVRIWRLVAGPAAVGWVDACASSTDSAQSLRPPFGRNACAVQRRPAQVNGVARPRRSITT